MCAGCWVTWIAKWQVTKPSSFHFSSTQHSLNVGNIQQGKGDLDWQVADFNILTWIAKWQVTKLSSIHFLSIQHSLNAGNIQHTTNQLNTHSSQRWSYLTQSGSECFLSEYFVWTKSVQLLCN